MSAKPAKSAAAKKPVVRKPAAKKVAAAKLPKPAKPGKKPKPAVAEQPAIAEVAKLRVKLVRDSFTMPRSDFALVQQLKDRAMGFRHAAKKSELLRAGLHALARLDTATLQALLGALPALKSGRPRKGG